jgi:hypothetical protein
MGTCQAGTGRPVVAAGPAADHSPLRNVNY